MIGNILSFVLRFIQILFAAVVLGLSVHLIRGQGVDGTTPATTTYDAFVGGFGMLTALLGIAAVFVDSLNGIIMAGIDALASIFFLAGGIAVAIGMHGVSCSNVNTKGAFDNALINGGCASVKGQKGCYYASETKDSLAALASRCRQQDADAAFLFMGFILSVGLAVMAFLHAKRGGAKANYV